MPPAILSFVRFIIMVIINVFVGPRVVTFSSLKIKLGYFINVVCVCVSVPLAKFFSLSMWLLFFGFIYSLAYTMSSESNTEQHKKQLVRRISHYLHIFSYFFMLCHFDHSIGAADAYKMLIHDNRDMDCCRVYFFLYFALC